MTFNIRSFKTKNILKDFVDTYNNLLKILFLNFTAIHKLLLYVCEIYFYLARDWVHKLNSSQMPLIQLNNIVFMKYLFLKNNTFLHGNYT